MRQARFGGGLLGSLVLGFLLGCAGAGDPIVAAPEDAGSDADDPVATDAGSDARTYSTLCFNRDKDPGETDFDCGGNCPPCGFGAACTTKTDCAKGACEGTPLKCTAPATCSNGKRDVKETDIDCGGPDCATCAATKKCSTGSDCASAACVSAACT